MLDPSVTLKDLLYDGRVFYYMKAPKSTKSTKTEEKQ